jgi:sec-independent protein translocase protein TatB
MFDVGFAEIFLLAVIGLLVLGPERLPGVARTLGGFIRKARMSWISLRNTIEAEMADADLSKPIKKASEELKQIGRELTETPAFKPGEKKPDPVVTDPASAGAAVPGPEPDSGKSENV